MSKRGGKFAIGAAVAAAAGYVAGILTAPKSGKETRKDIHDTALKARAEAEKRLKKVHTELQQLVATGQDRLQEASTKTKKGFEDALEQAKDVKSRAKDLLTAIHEGDSNDKDLQQAIDEADKAIEHLKTYVTKDTSRGKKTKK